jgi:hypothetical protein
VQVCQLLPACCYDSWEQGSPPDFDACAQAAQSLCASLAVPRARHVVTADAGTAQIDDTARISGFTITSGQADGAGLIDSSGAGVLVRNEAAPVIARCTLRSNGATRGGALAAFGQSPGPGLAQPSLVNCKVIGNSAGVQGGGIALEFHGAALIVNCLFADNIGLSKGGAIAAAGQGLNIYSSTFSNNFAFAGAGGGALWTDSAGLVAITNSILWGDQTGEIVQEGSGTVTVTYSNVQGGLPAGVEDGGGNLNVDPLFAGPGRYRLNSASPCIDAGQNAAVQDDYFDVNDNTSAGEDAPDLDLNLRVRHGAADDCPAAGQVDMGAYEFDRCRADCAQPPNGVVDVVDFLRLLQSWGDVCELCDIEPGDGVDVVDFLALLQAWGPCGQPGGPIPQTVQDCMTCCGSESLVIYECICKVEPCTAGCPPENCQ